MNLQETPIEYLTHSVLMDVEEKKSQQLEFGTC